MMRTGRVPRHRGRLAPAAVVIVLAAALITGLAAQASSGSPAAVPVLPEDVPRDAEFSSILIAGNKAGDQAVWKSADGALHVFSQFNDRGRGPVLRTVYRLGDDGLPVSVETRGQDYFKKPVEETFSLAGGRAVWRSTVETGEDPRGAGKFFLGLNSSSEELGILARALLRHGSALPLLPGGEVAIERIREIEVASLGRSIPITLQAIAGLDLAPLYVWLDRDGGLFATGSSWMMQIRRGWEEVAERLISVQEEAREERDRALAKKLARRPAGSLVFRDVSVFDAIAGAIVPHQDVVVRGDRIVQVAASPAPIGRRAVVIDGRGKTLLPGLWDMHVHVSPGDGLLHIAAGVTSVRDMANDIEDLAALRERIDAGRSIGPRIVAAGIIDGPGPYQAPTQILADTADQARAHVARYAALGYPQIKIYSSLEPKLVPVVIEDAHRRGLRVSGHIPATLTAEKCVRLGFDEIQHMNMVFLNFMPDVEETRTPARFLEPAARGADLDLASEPVRAFLRLLRDRNVVVDPTLAVFENLFTSRPGEIRQGLQAVASRLPVQMQRGLKAGGLVVPDGMDARYRQSFEAMKRMLRAMHDQGITIVAGTDDIAGFSLHRELEIYVEAGLPPPDVLRLATQGAAVLMRRNADLGSIATGRLADLVLVEGDPTRTIGDIRRTVLVVKSGTMFDPDRLHAALGIAPRTAAAPETR